MHTDLHHSKVGQFNFREDAFNMPKDVNVIGSTAANKVLICHFRFRQDRSTHSFSQDSFFNAAYARRVNWKSLFGTDPAWSLKISKSWQILPSLVGVIR